MKTTKESFQDLISGTRNGVGATLFRALARSVAAPYSFVVRTRNRLYDVGVLRSERVARPTVAVGNLTLGGVGKTPFIGWLAEFFSENGCNPGFVSRGYRAEKQRELFAKIDAQAENSPQNAESALPSPFAQFLQLNDEGRELTLRFPQIPHFQSPNRVDAANALLSARPETDVLLLDDAFQHRKIARDLNVVLLDALDPFGGGRVFPAGFLREPTSGLRRADAVLLNRADLIAENDRETIRRRVTKLAPNAVWAEIAQTPRFVYCPDADVSRRFIQTDYENWRETFGNRRFVAFCGLGAPAGFRRTLEARRLEIAEFLEFPDHCAYGDAELTQIAQTLTTLNADALLTTAKDYVKLANLAISGKPIFALGIGVEFLSNEAKFRALLRSRILDVE